MKSDTELQEQEIKMFEEGGSQRSVNKSQAMAQIANKPPGSTN